MLYKIIIRKNMKIGIIDVGWKQINTKNPLGEALGGSETWLIQIATEFAKNNEVDVYCNCKETNTHKGVTYKCESFFDANKKYDFIILNRVFQTPKGNYIDYITKNNLAEHIYLQMHDLSLQIGSQLVTNNMDLNKMLLNHPRLTLVTLNEWHYRNTKLQYPALLGDILCIPNGVDLELFPEKENAERDNRILWSSCMDRGAQILISDIYPLVKKEIHDFGVDIARYNDDHKVKDLEEKDIRFIGKLQKRELYNEMQKHKVWFYPGTFAETFCITLIENVLNGAKVVSPLTYGTGPTLFTPELFKMKFDFNNNYDIAVREAAQMIINILKSPWQKDLKYEEVKEKIRSTYNWSFSVNKYIEHFEKIKQNKKILILTMSCNNIYFKGLLGAVKDTWAKPIIHKKYPNVEWFSYTACDKKHPTPHIDFKDKMIYVDSGDDLYTTYEKTQKAYQMLKDAGVTFDYVVRTNTSVFVNIEKLLDRIDKSSENTILGGQVGYYHRNQDGKMTFKWNIIPGLFMAMSKKLFDIAMSATNQYDTIPTTDDVIISKRLAEVGDFKIESPNIGCETAFYRYKAYLPEDEERVLKLCTVKGSYVWDPNDINNSVVLQLRTLYPGEKERIEKGHEIEHFYELDDALLYI